jgi:putative transposase
MAAEGLQDLEIGRRLAIDRQTVARWRGRFLVTGIAGIAHPAALGPRDRIPEEKLQAIVRATVSRRAPGGRAWSTRQLAREFGVSHMTVRRLWESYGIRPVRFEVYPPRPDPVSPRAPWDVIGLYLRAPVAALLVTLHAPVLSASEEEPGRPRAPSPNPGSAAVGAAILPTAGAFRALPSTEANPGDRSGATDEFLRFLSELGVRIPGGTNVRVIATGLTPPALRKLDRWRVRRPRLEFEFSTDLAAWKTRAAREIRAAGRGPAPSRQYRGRAELTRSLARSVERYSEAGGAFEWSAGRREIAEGEAGYRLRYDLAVTGHRGFKMAPALPAAVASPPGPAANDRASARAVLRQYLRLRPRERLTVESWTSTLEYANAFVLEALRLGARPLLLYQDEPTYWAATKEVPARTLASIGEHRRAALERTDVFVSFFGPSDRERFHALPSPTLFRLGEYQDALYEAAAKAGARTVQMAVGRVSEASGRMYGVDVPTWRRELIEGTLVSPQVLRRRGRTIAERLEKGRDLEVRHPNGTKLHLRLAGRKPRVSDGAVAQTRPKDSWNPVTLPAGVVTVAVEETFAEGSFQSNVPSFTGLSDSVGEFRNGRWTFERGRLRRFVYDEGQELFAQSYGRAPEGRDRPGAVSIGLNDRIATAPLLEDQGLGTVSLHIGRNDYLGGRSRTPWWAWSLQRGSTVAVDGELLVRSGRIVT